MTIAARAHKKQRSPSKKGLGDNSPTTDSGSEEIIVEPVGEDMQTRAIRAVRVSSDRAVKALRPAARSILRHRKALMIISTVFLAILLAERQIFKPAPKVGKMQKIYNQVESATGSRIEDLKNAAYDAAGNLKTVITDAAGNIINAAQDAAGNLKHVASDAAGNLKTAGTDAAGRATDAAGNLKNSAYDAAGKASDVASNLKNSAYDAAGRLTDAAGRVIHGKPEPTGPVDRLTAWLKENIGFHREAPHVEEPVEEPHYYGPVTTMVHATWNGFKSFFSTIGRALGANSLKFAGKTDAKADLSKK